MSAKKTVCVLDPYHKDAVALLQSEPDLEVVPPDDPRKSHWREIAGGILVRSETRITAEDLNAASRLQVVVKQGVGVDNIDLDAAKERGVAVHNTPALNSEAVAELSLALALSLSRRVTELDRRIRSGERVVRSNALGMSLLKKTIGVVGMGNIGHAAARKWIGACEASVIGYDPVAPDGIWPDIPHKRVASLDELLRTADVVTLHVPLMQSTRGLIGARELTLMRDNAILINAARGGIVDEAALLHELRKGRLWGAVLDAVEKEPPTLEEHREFLDLDNVIMTPHIGGSTMENQSESGKAAAITLMAVLRGETSVGGKLV